MQKEKYVVSIDDMKLIAMNQIIEEFEVHEDEPIFYDRTKVILSELADAIDLVREAGTRIVEGSICQKEG